MASVKECEQLYTSRDKWKVSIIAGCLFLVVSLLYGLTDRLLGYQSSNVPHFASIIIQSILFIAIVRLIMY